MSKEKKTVYIAKFDRVMGVPETNDCGEPDDITPVCRERERLAEAITLAFCVIAIAASVLYAIVRALLK